MAKGIGPITFKAGDQARRVETFDLLQFADGFSFGVATELEAFQAAYAYQHCERVSVEPAADGSGWRVQVYRAGAVV